ncbi:MAG: DUF3152 domain-containing protein [Actinomycetota bacterium]|jgi:hypothetical protein
MGQRVWAAAIAVVAAVAVCVPAAAGARTGPLVISYDVRGRGNVSPLEDLAATAAEVYADPRGWSLGGSIRFERVETGGAFTLWLASDDRMSTFGGACDRLWSCRNGRNVVINEDRWLGSTESYVEAGASLETYRQMVLNHETGHWLGFGHAGCPRAGAPAPVMQQQSMTLAGCAPNSWPLPSERATLAARRGVPIVQAGGTRPTTTTRSGRDIACRGEIPRVALRAWMRCF